MKIHYMTFTLGSRSHKMLPSTLHSPHHMTYAPSPAKFEVATSNSLGEDAFTRKTLFDLDLWVKVTQHVAQYPLHHVTYSPANFANATSNSLGDAFTRKYII